MVISSSVPWKSTSFLCPDSETWLTYSYDFIDRLFGGFVLLKLWKKPMEANPLATFYMEATIFSNLILLCCDPYSPRPFYLRYWILEQNGSCLVQIKKLWRRIICRCADRFKWMGSFLKYPNICPWSFLQHFPIYGKYSVPTVNPHDPLLSLSTWWPLSLPNYPTNTYTLLLFCLCVSVPEDSVDWLSRIAPMSMGKDSLLDLWPT